jgi:hypothetical protein
MHSVIGNAEAVKSFLFWKLFREELTVQVNLGNGSWKNKN